MGIFDITTILMVLTALFSYINYRTLKLPTTIGVMGVSLLMSLGIAGMGGIRCQCAATPLRAHHLAHRFQ